MIEVFTKAPLANEFSKVLVRGRDRGNVDPDRRDAADAIELAGRQHAQPPRLKIGRHVADLVEKQRTAVGLLEAAFALRRGAGESAALVAEELGFQQVLDRKSTRLNSSH